MRLTSTPSPLELVGSAGPLDATARLKPPKRTPVATLRTLRLSWSPWEEPMAESWERARKRERNPIAALIRLLSVMAEREENSIGVRELARALGSPPSSIQRTLESAQEVSVVSPVGTGQWELGWELFRIASLAQRKQPYGAAAAVITELSEQTGETAVLTVYDKERAARMFVTAHPSRHSVRFVPDLFSWLPMHAGATALAILAHRPEDERQMIYDKGLAALTKTTLTTPSDLERTLSEVRDKGFAVSHDEVDLGASALAAPIFSTTGVTSSIGVIAPRQRFDEALERHLEARVVAAAARLDRRLGHPGSGLQTVP